MNTIGDYLKWAAGVLALVSVYLGVDSALIEKQFIFSIALSWWAAGAFCALILLGISEIIDLQERILESSEKNRLLQPKNDKAS